MLTIKGNNALLNLAIGNLISNAIKYSDNQQVQILFKVVKDRLTIDISDTGIGIDKNTLYSSKFLSR